MLSREDYVQIGATAQEAKRARGANHRVDCSSLARCKCDREGRDYTEAEAVFLGDKERGYTVCFDGLVFCYPFVCLCCGVQIDVEQFCFGRSCGRCDVGHCDHAFNRDLQRMVKATVRRIPDGERTAITAADIMMRRHLTRGW